MRTYISIALLLGCVTSAVQAQAPTDKETCQKAAMAIAIKLDQAEPNYTYYPEANYNVAEARCYVGIQKYGPRGPDGKYGKSHNEDLFLYDGQTGKELARAIKVLTLRDFSGFKDAPTTGPAQHLDVVYDVEKTGTIEQDQANYTDAYEYIGNKLRECTPWPKCLK